MNRLTNIKSGKDVMLILVDGSFEKETRLAEIGMLPGEKIKVINNPGYGSLVVSVKGTKLALGHGLAKRLLVSEV